MRKIFFAFPFLMFVANVSFAVNPEQFQLAQCSIQEEQGTAELNLFSDSSFTKGTLLVDGRLVLDLDLTTEVDEKSYVNKVSTSFVVTKDDNDEQVLVDLSITRGAGNKADGVAIISFADGSSKTEKFNCDLEY